MKTILVIEDEIVIAELVATLLEDAGYQVVLAYNGREGLRLLGQTQPDLVLSDIMMPGMDGWAVCRAMHADPAFAFVPLVFMSARGLAPNASECAYAAFLPKPFEPDVLLAMLSKLIGPAVAV